MYRNCVPLLINKYHAAMYVRGRELQADDECCCGSGWNSKLRMKFSIGLGSIAMG